MKTPDKLNNSYTSLIQINKKFYNIRFIKKNILYSNTVESKSNILFKIKLKNYSGVRHQTKLPVRGQRTKTNAKTCKQRNKLRK
jgi:small subunit ribosomal protein S13